MRIWHVGASPSFSKVDGVNTVVWLAACAQAQLGHDVSLLLGAQPDPEASRRARESSLQLLHVPSNLWQYDAPQLRRLLHSQPPNVVHFHSVFIPAQATLTRRLAHHRIPTIITPHGGLSPHVLARGRLKKALYNCLIERPRFRSAAAITVVTPPEENEVRAFVPDYHRPICCVPNPVDVTHLQSHAWTAPASATHPPRIVYMGRFDVLHKGIDLLLEIAQRVPDAEFHLYGIDDPRTRTRMQQLRAGATPNVRFHPPIFGSEKTQVLATASLYLQTSRWDASPISVAEAMFLGLPCAITETMNHAEPFRQHALGLTLPFEPDGAAQRLRHLLTNPLQLARYSENSRRYARDMFLPSAAATNYLRVYEQVLASDSPADPQPLETP